MILLPDGRILLSGGATVDEKCVPSYHKDLRQLDTETMLWSKAKTDGGARLTILAAQLGKQEWNDCLFWFYKKLPGSRASHSCTKSTTKKTPERLLLITGVKISSRCNHTLTSDEEGQAAIIFGGWGLGGLQRRETNKRAGAMTLAACSMPPCEAVSITLPHLRGRGEPEHK